MPGQVLLWVLCGAVGIFGLVGYIQISFGLWLTALRSQTPPRSTKSYLLRSGLAVLAVLAAVYVALLTYSMAYLDWLGAFMVVTVLVVVGAVGSIGWRIHWLNKGEKRKFSADHKG